VTDCKIIILGIIYKLKKVGNRVADVFPSIATCSISTSNNDQHSD
jgi:hypothetical protein